MLDRQWAHIPIGLLVSYLIFLLPAELPLHVRIGGWVAAALIFFGFIVYETTEDDAINDEAYRDVAGMVIGLGVGAGVQLAYIIARSYL